jgi:hypothetical protein
MIIVIVVLINGRYHDPNRARCAIDFRGRSTTRGTDSSSARARHLDRGVASGFGLFYAMSAFISVIVRANLWCREIE